MPLKWNKMFNYPPCTRSTTDGLRTYDVGKEKLPGITVQDLGWTKDEIVEYLSSGFTPDYDVVGGKMASVVENISQLTTMDKELIAQYLLRIK